MEEQLKTLLTELAQFTKDVSPDVWAILLTQQFIWGISSIIAAFIAIALLFWVYARGKADDWCSDGWGIMAIVLGTTVIIAIAVVLVEGLPRLLNPAYHALMSLKP